MVEKKSLCLRTQKKHLLRINAQRGLNSIKRGCQDFRGRAALFYLSFDIVNWYAKAFYWSFTAILSSFNYLLSFIEQ